MHLRRHYRAIAVDDLTNGREQDPQGTVLAVHISEDVDPKMRRDRQVCGPEKGSVDLGRLLLKASDRSPATLPGSRSLVECFDAITSWAHAIARETIMGEASIAPSETSAPSVLPRDG